MEYHQKQYIAVAKKKTKITSGILKGRDVLKGAIMGLMTQTIEAVCKNITFYDKDLVEFGLEYTYLSFDDWDIVLKKTVLDYISFLKKTSIKFIKINTKGERSKFKDIIDFDDYIGIEFRLKHFKQTHTLLISKFDYEQEYYPNCYATALRTIVEPLKRQFTYNGAIRECEMLYGDVILTRTKYLPKEFKTIKSRVL